MARIQITIDIPPAGPAQVSITSDDNDRTMAPTNRAQFTQAKSDGSADARMLMQTREAKGWSQLELAKRIGCSQPTIGNIERGRQRITEALREKIRKAGIIMNGGR